jgi:hypothetical protein
MGLGPGQLMAHNDIDSNKLASYFEFIPLVSVKSEESKRGSFIIAELVSWLETAGKRPGENMGWMIVQEMEMSEKKLISENKTRTGK